MTHPIIKLVLLAGIALVALFALRGGTRPVHRVVWRASVVGGVLAAGASVLFPDTLTRLAHKVGVGRGTDLVLYVLVVTVMLVSVVLFRRISDLERKYVALARTFAIREAQEREGDDSAEATSEGA